MTELLLVESTERRWFGVVRRGEELFKVIIFPGSATTDWHAILTPSLFVELTEGNKLTQAIEKAYTEKDLPPQTNLMKARDEVLLAIANDCTIDPKFRESLLEVMKG